MKASLLLAATALGTSQLASANPKCRYLPGDPQWPSVKTWGKFNSTVGGKLVASIPIGSPCHDPTYDEAACQALRDEWENPLTQYVAVAGLF